MINILDPIPLINKNEWSSWTSLKNEYKISYRNIDRFSSQERNERRGCKASLEVASNIKSELRGIIKELEKKCLYEWDALSKDEVINVKLSERQRQIAELRQHYTIRQISKMLNIEQKTVFNTYYEALKKIEKYLRLNKKERKIQTLSNQQRKIYLMLVEKRTSKEIIEKLGISKDTLKVQKKRIELKLGGTKS